MLDLTAATAHDDAIAAILAGEALAAPAIHAVRALPAPALPAPAPPAARLADYPSQPGGLPHARYTAQHAPRRPYSYSQLEILDQCPRRYWLRYLAHVEQGPKSRPLLLGSAIHDDVIEPAFRAALAGGVIPATADAVERGLRARLDMVDDSLREDAAAAVESLSRWLRSAWHASFAACSVIAVETGIALHADGRATAWTGGREDACGGAIFRTRLDLALVRPADPDDAGGPQHVAVVDWKTGGNRRNRYKPEDRDGEQHGQLATQAAAALAWWPRAVAAAATFFNVRTADVPEPPTTFADDRVGRTWIAEHVQAVESRDWRDQNAWPAVESRLCHFCDFLAGCPLHAAKRSAKASADAALSTTPRLLGVLEAVVYAKAGGGDWKKMRFAVPGQGVVFVTGELAAPAVGGEYDVAGRWSEWQGRPEFKALAFRAIEPTTPEAVERVLVHLPAFGRVRARLAVARFGARALDAIRNDPDAVADACRMPAHHVAEAAEALEASAAELATKAALMSLLPTAHTRVINLIWKAWREAALAEIAANPYRLLEVRGIGWDTADSVAAQRGVVGADPRRVRAGLQAVLLDAETDGHTLLPAAEFAERAELLLGVPREVVRRDAAELRDEGLLVIGAAAGDRPATVQLASNAADEAYLASRLHELRREAFRNTTGLRAAALEGLVGEQADAVRGVMEHGVGVITGPPGSGKTTVLKALLECLPATRRVALCAPTGKAARVMSQATGRPASTIHSLLAGANVARRPGDEELFKRGGDDWAFGYDADNPMPYDCLIVDECSMVDHRLGCALLAALPPHAWVVLIGDADQLPSVGAGELLGCLVRADLWPVHRLKTVHRNAGVGRAACVQVIHGERPTFGNMAVAASEVGNNAWEIVVPAEQQPELVAQIATSWAATKGFAPGDVAVLTANRKAQGPVCAPRLNEHLQAALNPGGMDTGIKDPVVDRTWRVGDRLMQTKNDRAHGLVNGDTLRLVEWDAKAQRATLRVDADDRLLVVAKPRSALDLQLAYACTVHKMQGSQAPIVVVCLDAGSQGAVLSRQWLYTALSRFRSYVFLLSDSAGDTAKVVARQAARRWTGLAARLERPQPVEV